MHFHFLPSLPPFLALDALTAASKHAIDDRLQNNCWNVCLFSIYHCCFSHIHIVRHSNYSRGTVPSTSFSRSNMTNQYCELCTSVVNIVQLTCNYMRAPRELGPKFVNYFASIASVAYTRVIWKVRSMAS